MASNHAGQFRLADELGASRNTVEAALRLLEHEGVLISQGLGRKRLIASPDPKKARPMRIVILDYEPMPVIEGYTVELQYILNEAGHVAFFAPKTLMELGMNVSRIRRMVEKTEADARIVCSATKEVLMWFATQPLPAFALFGGRRGLPIAAAGPEKIPATLAATRALVRRIVRWSANVSQKKPDLRQTLTHAEFITGGTIGPVARSGRNFKR
jgi:hypothetical protein